MPTGRHLLALMGLLAIAAAGGCAADQLDHQGRCTEKVLVNDFEGDDLELLRGYTRVGGGLLIPEGVEELSALGCLEQVDGGLVIDDLPGLESLAGLENLRTVGGLSLSDLPRVHTLAPLSRLEVIEYGLSLDGLTGMDNVDGPTGITRVGSVDLIGWPGLRTWEPVLGGGEIEWIQVYELPAEATISAFSGFTSADHIYIGTWPVDAQAEGATIRLDGLTTANTLALEGMSAASIASLGALEDAGWLSLTRYGGRDLSGLASLHTLEQLQVSEAPRLESLSGLENLVTLTGLSIGDNPVLTQVDALAQLRTMPFIVEDRANHGTLTPSIGIAGCPLLADLSGLSTIDADTLPWLYLDELPALTALPAFVSISQLGFVTISGTAIHDLDALSGVSTLSYATDAESVASGTLHTFSVELAGNASLVDVSGLMAVSGVGSWGDIYVNGNPMLPDCAVDELVAAFDAVGRTDGQLEVADNGGDGGC